jgi:dienelactone hydrolase
MPEITAGPTSGYLAVPAGPQGRWPGVVVIHESFFGEHLRSDPAPSA